MPFLIIWILFGVGCAICASNKKRSGVGWFFLGMLLGPFALIFILLLAPLPQKEELRQAVLTPQAIIAGQTKRCPKCAESIKFEALKCRFCGEEFDPDQVRQAVSDRLDALSRGAILCPRCGEFGVVQKAMLPNGGFGPWCPICRKPVLPNN
ncbi:MAG: hypothetical protein WAK96_07420 [Desulfobaccales bacterium]